MPRYHADQFKVGQVNRERDVCRQRTTKEMNDELEMEDRYLFNLFLIRTVEAAAVSEWCSAALPVPVFVLVLYINPEFMGVIRRGPRKQEEVRWTTNYRSLVGAF